MSRIDEAPTWKVGDTIVFKSRKEIEELQKVDSENNWSYYYPEINLYVYCNQEVIVTRVDDESYNNIKQAVIGRIKSSGKDLGYRYPSDYFRASYKEIKNHPLYRKIVRLNKEFFSDYQEEEFKVIKVIEEKKNIYAFLSGQHEDGQYVWFPIEFIYRVEK